MATNTPTSLLINHICDSLPINLTNIDLIEYYVSDESNYEFRYYACGPLLTFFIVIGILSNSLCFYVFKPCQNGRTSNTPPIFIYLFALAIWDLILLCTSFFLYNLPEWSRGLVLNEPIYATTRPYFYYITNAAHTNSNWVVVALGLERYFALCYPFKHWLMDNARRRAIRVICVISIAGVLYNLPRLFEVLYEFGPIPQCVLTEDGYYELIAGTAERVSVRQNVLYRTIYKIVGGTLLYSVGPFLCLLIVSIRVSAAIRKQRLLQNRLREGAEKKTSQTGREDGQNGNERDLSHSINVMLVAVVIKLLFVHSLPTGLDVAETTMGDEAFSADQTVEYLITFLALLLAANASCNFFIYYACSKRFRQDLRKVWIWLAWWKYCCRKKSHEACVVAGLATSAVIVHDSLIKQTTHAAHV